MIDSAVFLNRIPTVDMDTQPRRIVCEPEARHVPIRISEFGKVKRSIVL